MMFGGEQGKGYMDHRMDAPVEDPGAFGFYALGAMVGLAGVVIWAFGLTWWALVAFVAVGALGAVAYHRLSGKPDGTGPQPNNHPPTDYR